MRRVMTNSSVAARRHRARGNLESDPMKRKNVGLAFVRGESSVTTMIELYSIKGTVISLEC